VRIEEDTPDAELDSYHELGVRAIRLDLFAAGTGRSRRSWLRAPDGRAGDPRGWHIQF